MNCAEAVKGNDYVVETPRKPVLYFPQNSRTGKLKARTGRRSEMPMRIKLAATLSILIAVHLISVAPLAQDADALHHFDYDQKAPLGLKEIGVEQRGDIAIHDISYTSPKGGAVPAYLVVPKGNGPFAAVIWDTGTGKTPPCATARSFSTKPSRSRTRA